MGWTVRACGYLRFLPKSFVGFALTAVEAFVLVENVMEYLLFSSLSRTNALYNMVLPSLFGEMDLHQRNWNNIKEQRESADCKSSKQKMPGGNRDKSR